MRLKVFAAAAMGAFVAGCATKQALVRDVAAIREVSARHHESVTKESAAKKDPLSLQDAIRLALERNKALQAVRLQGTAAGARVAEARSALGPSVTVSASYSKLDAVNSFDVGGREVTLGFTDNYSADATVRQPVFRGGGVAAGVRAAEYGNLLADEYLRGAVQGVIFETCANYFGVVLSAQLLEVYESSLKSADAHLADVEQQKRLGTASGYDVLRAQVEVANAKAEVIRERNALTDARAALRKTTGMTEDGEFKLSDTIGYLPAKPVLEEAVRMARLNRPDLFHAELSLQIQKQALRIARSRHWPQVDVFFTQKWANPDPHSSTTQEWGDAWVAGGAVQLSLFDSGGTSARVRQEEARLAQRRVELSDAEDSAVLEVQRTLSALQNAEEMVDALKSNLDRADEALRLAESGYRQGVRREIEVIDARTARQVANVSHFRAVYGHAIERLKLQKALGVLGPGPAEGANVGTFDPREKSLPGEVKR